MWFWFCRHVEYKSYGVTDSSIKISKESLGDHTVCVWQGQSLWQWPLTVMCEDVRVKLKLHWRHQEDRDVRSMEQGKL
jgi:hypothetical protein